MMKVMKQILIVSLLSVVALNSEETKNIKSTTTEVKESNASNVMKMAFFPLKHYHSAVVRTKIKPFLDKEAKIISFKFNNTVVLRAYPSTIKRVEEVINKIESSESLDATVLKFKKASVKDIHEDINEISEAIFPQEITSERVRIIDSNLTNSLILVGKKENRKKLVQTIELLDIEGGFISKEVD